MDKVKLTAELKTLLDTLHDGTYKTPREYTVLQNRIDAICDALDLIEREGK